MKLNPFLFAIPGICDLVGYSSWIWNSRKHLVCIFSSPLCLFNKSLAESCKRQREVPFQGWGWNLQGLFCMWAWQMENVSKGSLHKWQPSTPCVNALGKHRRRKYLSLLLENCLILYLSKHMTISLYFDNVSWQAQVSQFDQHRVHLRPTGSWLRTTTGCQSWFPSSTPSPGDTRKYIKVYIIYNRFLFLYSLPETWFKQVQDLDIHTLLFSTESEALVPVPLVSFLVIT